jgi:hypothetical protein
LLRREVNVRLVLVEEIEKNVGDFTLLLIGQRLDACQNFIEPLVHQFLRLSVAILAQFVEQIDRHLCEPNSELAKRRSNDNSALATDTA